MERREVFFNVGGIRWTILGLLAVVALCVVDLHCSFVRDRRRASAEKAPPPVGAIARVKGEVAAGRKELAAQRLAQVNEQLRDMRILAKRLVKKGDMRRARAAITLIGDLERQAKALEEKATR